MISHLPGLRRPLSLVLLSVGAATTTSPAWCASAADSAAAETLFVDARKLMGAGNYAAACPKLAESQRLDPGAGTLLNLGDCYEHIGKLASAWGAFRDAIAASRNAGQENRVAEATRRAQALEARLPKLIIVVPPQAALPGLELHRDGEVVGEGQWRAAVPVDPGPHTVEARAPGYKPWTTMIRVDAVGVPAQLEVPPLEKGSAIGWSDQRVAGVTVAAVGAAGMIVGAVFGAAAIAKKNDANANCQPQNPDLCNATGVGQRHDELTFAHVSTGTFIVGGAAVAAGVITFFTAPAAPAVGRIELSPVLAPGLAGVSARMIW